MRIAVSFLVIYFAAFTAPAQHNFISTGVIKYEKRTNQFKMLDASEIDQHTLEIARQGSSKILIDYFELYFNETRSVYRLARSNSENRYFIMNKPAEDDRVIKDLSRNELHLERTVLGNSYTVRDSLNRYEWKIMNETRTIAGFECKKAVARVFDSVYVVAFFYHRNTSAQRPGKFLGAAGYDTGNSHTQAIYYMDCYRHRIEKADRRRVGHARKK